ncbi:hypothetical protein A2313_01270 [Candidatus Roizmanbacteria bacterium RIFOXYB2_FULL_41_10]|uniref:ABC transporter permease n=1 Tax=Candidatus Roizmanbacteria bacterium RIFOXYA1_FULL_41_12 TaxID=1802082 RepID=A0A1F7KFI1_9BACT|nr:MAG: hypothetical protein A2209_00020 [Candidatus Roizmanbacteria bacterium RIFOXYA1_FULL_41_12]OGK67628.1 MAG: hypothetical protein A2377_00655 [Candidatus Roizmanbacteria bacterium RIFOXYB1_FULL_41_27]OGK68488.1 MAG: hypothetical protein A2262_00975 [Candidatus Roizmanbacteria bacterium RIFOXYA2_FULL_41_8]OGK71012.1 MAG: hypothetical protein A2313_01270 [Candidatus Roizmanbacteria bacterium RIFOXYB2_FULL_41_10]OGK71350.1 MAG: hypothetical protein A2403_01040 [Candidatus Roizmanbacteria bac
MKRYLKLYWLFSVQSLKVVWQHKTGVLFFMFGKLIRFLMFLFFVMILVKNTKTLVGYTFNETLVFYFTFNVIDTLTQMLFREVYRFRWLVTSGELDGVLVRPYHPFIRVLLGGLDILDLLMLGPYLALLTYFLLQIGLTTSYNLSLYLLLVVNSLIIATAFHIVVLALGVLTTEVDHTIMIYRDLSKLAVVPVDIYREPIRSLVTFVLPIGIMMTYPVKGLLNMLNWNLIIVSLVLGLASLLFSLWLWGRALKKYQSWGS